MLNVKSLRWLWISIVVLVIDQVSKCYLGQVLDYNHAQEILPFFNLTLTYNSGASFGFLNSQSGWQVYLLMAVTIVVVVGLLIWMVRLPSTNKLILIALSFIVGGAIGNFIDRVRYSYVIDFLDFHYQGWHFAIFNLADTAICIGAFLLAVHMLFFSKP